MLTVVAATVVVVQGLYGQGKSGEMGLIHLGQGKSGKFRESQGTSGKLAMVRGKIAFSCCRSGGKS